MTKKITAEYENAVKDKIENYSWYHSIELLPGVFTKGFEFDRVWDIVRQARTHINYKDKSVLDLGSWDGMWAFEAEQLGGKEVVATDIWPVQGGGSSLGDNNLEKFLFCREVLKSEVVPYYNVSVYELTTRLNAHLWGNRGFDVVQHLGLLYHLRDPMAALIETRRVMKRGGYLLIETAIVDDDRSFMLFNHTSTGMNFYNDPTSWWACTPSCLEHMLRTSLFKVLDGTAYSCQQQSAREGQPISRRCLVAEAIGLDDIENQHLRDELSKQWRDHHLIDKRSLDVEI